MTHLLRTLSAALSLLPLVAAAQQVSYPVFEEDKIPASQFTERRQALKSQLGSNAIAILFTNPERNRNNDCDFRFRADSNFLYLTGFEEPDAALLLVPGGVQIDGKTVTEVLFVNENDPMSVTWLGYRMGSKDAKTLLGIDAVYANTADNFNKVLKALDSTAHPHLYRPSAPPEPSGKVAVMLRQYTDWESQHKDWEQPTGSLGGMLARQRVKKSAEELTMLRKAATASAMGHREVMRSVQPGMREYQLQGIIEYLLTRNGCESVGYNSIVGSGPNSCILHYEEDRRKIQTGDMICMDAAGEYHGYSADVTRSFPSTGRFTPAQREIYQLVLDAQNAGIAQCKEGNNFGAPGRAAEKVITEGLLKLGIIKKPGEMRTYLPHGISHYIGLDVHDAHGDNTLHSGYVLTVEPGLYIRAGSPCDPKYWNIGVRIEDDILVTSKGPENLSAGAPRTIAEIESLMKQTGIGKKPVGQ